LKKGVEGIEGRKEERKPHEEVVGTNNVESL